MSSFASRHNKGGVNWGVQTDDWKYCSLESLYKGDPERVHVLHGIWINNKGRYGDQPVGILDRVLVNLPGYMCDEVRGILASEADIADIKAGKVGFIVETYRSKEGRLCYGIRWQDVEPDELPFA